MTVYFSHPTFTYHTETERKCISKIRKKFSEEIVNPSEKGFRSKSKEMIDKSDKIVGVAIEDKVTFLVNQEVKYAKNSGNKAYIINVEEKNLISDIRDFSRDDFEILTLEKTKEFKANLRKEDLSVTGFLFGGKSRF
ncbi:hypothetical protein C9439_01060 [archaeon SCG-AAA382B04]|nr:hypothetical protein C9439_01060 [archaeon SCG-AAA382B04]